MRTGIALCASLMAALFTSSVHADEVVNLLTNGSLEKDPNVKVKLRDGHYVTISTTKNQAVLPGWSVISGSVDLVRKKWFHAPEGMNWSIDMIGTPGVGAIAQTVSGELEEGVDKIEAGTVYQFTFDLSANPFNGPKREKKTVRNLRVTAYGADGETVLATHDYSITRGTRKRKDMQWVTDSEVLGQAFTFTADGSAVTIVVEALASDPLPKKATAQTIFIGPVIANLNLFAVGGNPVPEPASLGILGVGASALLLRKRRGR